MTKPKITWLFIFLAALSSTLPMSARAGDYSADRNHTSSGIKSTAGKRLIATKSKLKRLVPEEDLSLEPDPSEVFDQAVKEYSAGHMPQAQKLFVKSLELDPSNADAHFNLGAIYEWSNNLPEALKQYLAALALKPNDKEIREAVKAVQFKIKNKPALEAQARREKQEQAMATHGQQAKLAFSSQDYAAAVTHLTYLANSMPEDAKIQFALGQSLRALKYYNWAAYRLKLAIFLDPDNERYRRTLVELDQEIQDVQEQAYADTADMALKHMAPPTLTEVSDEGFAPHVF